MSGMTSNGDEFTGFGPSFLDRGVLGESGSAELAVDDVACRRLIRGTVPADPGVYGWINSDGRLVYVGKSKALRFRLVSYFASTPADPKMGRIRAVSARIVWQPVGHELLALLREQELIHRWRPEFNSQGQPHRRQPAFIAISDSAAPHAFMSRRATSRAAHCFGPIIGTGELREAVAALNQVFRLRDCSDRTGFSFGEQLPLFGDLGGRPQCLRAELGSCPAPCVGGCPRPVYQGQVDRAVRFLTGADVETVVALEERMLAAARSTQFERAGILCQQWKSLRWLSRQLDRLRTAERKIHGLLPVQVSSRRTLCLVFSRGTLVNSLPLPRAEARKKDFERQMSRLAGSPVLTGDDTLSVNLRLIVGSWFRKHREWLDAIVPFDEAANQVDNLRDVRLRQSA